MSATVLSDDETAHLIALASLDQVGRVRLGVLLDNRNPLDAWKAVLRGWVRVPGVDAQLASAWTQQARGFDLEAALQAHRDAGVEVVCAADDRFGDAFVGDPDPPVVLFVKGDLDAVRGPAVALVGTRDCTQYGLELANEFGRELSLAGVSVVSGLAKGIDGAAHRGVVSVEGDGAPPIAVVGTGIDVVYPADHHMLWDAISSIGVLMSEHPLGVRARQWHFPARNRLIAALADVTVVIESPVRGGSMITVEQAILRGKDVLAVPGSVRSPSSVGTNRLLYDGCGMARSPDDVLFRLGLVPRVSAALEASRQRRTSAAEPQGDAATVLDAIGWEASSMDQLLVRTGLSLGAIAAALAALEDEAWITSDGSWFERRAAAGACAPRKVGR